MGITSNLWIGCMGTCFGVWRIRLYTDVLLFTHIGYWGAYITWGKLTTRTSTMSEKLKVRNAFPVGLYNATIRLSTIMCTYSLHLIVIKQALHATIDRITEKRNEINTIPCTWFPKYNTRNMSIVTNRLVMDVMVQKKTLIFLYTVGRTGKYTLTPHSQTQIKNVCLLHRAR